MEPAVQLDGVADRTIRDLTRRVTGLELERVASVRLPGGETSSLSVLVVGDYQLTLTCAAENRLLRAIACKMLRHPPSSDEEFEVCVKEFFNLLCGHIVSMVNREAHCSARFSVPEFYVGDYPTGPGSGGRLYELCYECAEGRARFRTEHRQIPSPVPSAPENRETRRKGAVR